MTDRKNSSKTLKPSKKHALKTIATRLEEALPELKMALGDKKFFNRVKKAAKILGEDFALIPASHEPLPDEAAYETVEENESTSKKIKPAKKAAKAKEIKKDKSAKKGKAEKTAKKTALTDASTSAKTPEAL